MSHDQNPVPPPAAVAAAAADDDDDEIDSVDTPARYLDEVSPPPSPFRVDSPATPGPACPFF
ncbi:hypothetical protein HK405_008644, partial [Cladochytrium tenue]